MMQGTAYGISSGRTAFTASTQPPARSPCVPSKAAKGAQARRPHRSARLACSAAAGAKNLVPCKLIGVGSAVPQRVLTNVDLETLVDTTDEWIATRTGIRQRHILGKDESLTQLAAQAGLRAIEMAGLKPEDIDMVLFATSTAEDIFGNATQVSYVCILRVSCL